MNVKIGPRSIASGWYICKARTYIRQLSEEKREDVFDDLTWVLRF